MYTMGSIKRSFFVFLAGLLSILFIIEILLRIIGAVYIAQNSKIDEIAKKNIIPGRNILCFGDSFTFGFGAPRGRGYPGQLDEIFNKKLPDKGIRVFNFGVDSQNSSMLLRELENQIIIYSPKFIIVMTGGANTWNFWGYSDYIER